MTWTVADFGLDKTGPQFAWLDQRLTVHGFPANHLLDDLQMRLQRWQRKQGWKGSGADGLMGPKSLAGLTADPKPVPTPPPSAIDRSIWKWTGPTPLEGDDPIEMYPLSATFEDAPWFVRRADGISFRAPASGAHTPNSSYPRSELREMEEDGGRADWSNASGVHQMEIVQAITHLPDGKREVVAGQIHDADDDVVMIRLEGSRLFVESGGDEVALLDPNYQLGARFTVRIVADRDGIAVHYNGHRHHITSRIISGAYFKAGCYTQASSTVPKSSPKYGTGYGEVVIFSLKVSHS